jgi:putative hemolysin
MEISIIFLLIVLNGVFATAEIALVSVRKPRLQQLADGGNTSAHVALDLANKPERFLPTTQLGMTLIGILMGAFGHRTLSERVEAQVNRIPTLAPYGETLSLLFVVVVITYFALVIGELVPKRLVLHSLSVSPAFSQNQ